MGKKSTFAIGFYFISYKGIVQGACQGEHQMEYAIRSEEKFKFIATGEDKEPLLLLHGLFGALSNFEDILSYFGTRRNVVVPILPMYEMPLRKVSVSGLVEHVSEFVEYMGFEKVHVMGNSLGGHIAILFALAHPEKIASIILTGSSGLFENAMGSSFPPRSNYEFIKKKTEATFYNPEVASKELVDEVFDTVNDRNKAIRVLATAKSAIRHNLSDKLHEIKAPTLLVWGKQDIITPPFVGEKFKELIPHAQLVFIEECGHAPMMEHPETFNKLLEDFLNTVSPEK
jgi:2-hydroxy-6-oxonona-2,4-dienedioate hydrolase